MKEFLKALKYVVIFQLISWGLFILIDELIGEEMLSLRIGACLLIVELILYFKFEKKIITENNYNRIIFNVSLIILWILFSILGTAITIHLVDMKILHYCSGEGWDCFLNGIEYMLFGFGLVIEAGIVIVWKIIYNIYKFIKNKINK